jgi:peptide/nickel transport system substrate-binding protein
MAKVLTFKDTTPYPRAKGPRLSTAAVLVLVGLLASCHRSEPDPQVFHYNQESPILSLDPAMARDQAGNWTARLLFNRLVELDSSLRPVPSLALSWSVEAGGCLYRFTLRDSVWFHRDPSMGMAGSRMVRAADVAFSLNRLMDPATASPGAWIFRDRLGKGGIRATDSLHLEIHLKTPFPPLLGLLSMGYCSVVAPEAVRHYGAAFRAHPVGTGPFALSFWEEGEGLVMQRHPKYFEKDRSGRPLPYLKAVQVHALADKSAAAMAFLQGRLDVLWSWEPALQRYLLDSSLALKQDYRRRFQLVQGPYLNTEYLGFLLNPDAKAAHPALQDRQVRLALHYGTDRNTLVRALRGGMGTPGWGGLIPPGLPGHYPGLPHSAYQPELARRYLTKAGYGPARTLQLQLETNPSYSDLAQFLQAHWKPLGINLQIRVSQGPTLRQMISGQEATVFRASWIADYPDAENYLALAYGPHRVPYGPNYTCFENPDFDRRYKEALLQPELSLRAPMYRAMDSLLHEQQPLLVLYYDRMFQLLRQGWTGWRVNPLNIPDFRYLRRVEQR